MHKNRDEVHAENWLALALGLRNAGKLKERLLCCVQDKSNKIRNNRDIEEFSQWWLLLADYVEYGISDVDCEELKRWLIDKKGFWANRLQLVEEEN